MLSARKGETASFLAGLYRRLSAADILDESSGGGVAGWQNYIHSLSQPKDCVDLSFCKYKCRMRHFSFGKRVILTLASIPMLMLLAVKRGRATGSVPDVPTSTLLLEESPLISSEDIFPEALKEDYSEMVAILRSGRPQAPFTSTARSLYRRARRSHPLSFHYGFWVAKELSIYSGYLIDYSPRAIAVYDAERNVALPVITELCERHGCKFISFMHGEYPYESIQAFMGFSKYYVWDEHYVRLFRDDLRCKIGSYEVYIPPKYRKAHVLPGRESKVDHDFTYYLSGEKAESFPSIAATLLALQAKGYRCAVRFHPRCSDRLAVFEGFEGLCIEDPNETSMEESLRSTLRVVGVFSTALLEAWACGVDVVVDDISDPDLYRYLIERQGAILCRRHKLMSEFFSTNERASN